MSPSITQAELMECRRLFTEAHRLAGGFAARMRAGMRVEPGPVKVCEHFVYGEPNEYAELTGFSSSGVNINWGEEPEAAA